MKPERTELYDRNNFNLNPNDTANPVTTEQASIVILIRQHISEGNSCSRTIISPLKLVKTEVMRLLSKGKTEEAIYYFINYTEKHGAGIGLDVLYQLSGRWHRIAYGQAKGTITLEDEMAERNKISSTLLEVMEQSAD